MSSSKTRYSCAVEVTLELICGKWKCIILWWLRRGGKRFGELMYLLPKITQKVLTQQLRELEKDGLVERKVYKEKPRRVEYYLTPEGETLGPILQAMSDWGKAKKPEFQFCSVDLEGLHVLVLTDMADFRDLLRLDLGVTAKARLTILSVTPRVENLQQIQPDVVVVDLGEQDLSPLMQQIQLLEIELGKSIPAIALIETSDRRRAFTEGFKLVFTKPVESVEIAAAIASLAGRYD
ncbi:winged helix-turn-helix transcriptional regulator [Mastigocoleus testarum]|uniref:winged helix-turn-helix transcriptional regulator n=1 Tax=Mastigocoleus testarum TaxID=996925 RepID=UPI0007C6FB67|nr:winged helix-turn-helix transcriptional regulator [Mastigocoleus testarum]